MFLVRDRDERVWLREFLFIGVIVSYCYFILPLRQKLSKGAPATNRNAVAFCINEKSGGAWPFLVRSGSVSFRPATTHGAGKSEPDNRAKNGFVSFGLRLPYYLSPSWNGAGFGEELLTLS